MSNTLPKRKELRLKQYDYSTAGAYFITICVQDRKRILSDVIPPTTAVGVGALDDPQKGALDDPLIPQIRLTETGKTVEKYLLSSENIPGVKIDRFVIMPDHIHVIVFLDPSKYKKRQDGSSRAPFCGSSRAPTPTNAMLPHVISAFKRLCSKEMGTNIFQRGYMEHIIRDRDDYEARAKYIYENPIRWYYEQN